MYLSKNISFNTAVKKKDLWPMKNGLAIIKDLLSLVLPKISLNNTRGLGHNFAPFVTLIDKLSFCEDME